MVPIPGGIGLHVVDAHPGVPGDLQDPEQTVWVKEGLAAPDMYGTAPQSPDLLQIPPCSGLINIALFP
jgi:hypothetical protein